MEQTHLEFSNVRQIHGKKHENLFLTISNKFEISKHAVKI